jgi:hypothetical protein
MTTPKSSSNGNSWRTPWPGVGPTTEPLAASAVMKAMSGTWVGEQGETYTLLFPDINRWNCVCCEAQGLAMADLSFDEELGLVWWGKQKVYFVMAAEVVVNNHCARWYTQTPGGDTWTQKPSFVWTRQEPTASSNSPASSIDLIDLAQSECLPPPSIESIAEAASRATHEVMRQLLDQGGQGKIWLPHWNEQYRDLLGPCRDFLAAQPGKFIVNSSKGSRKYTVAVVDQSASLELDVTRKCLAKVAVREVMKQVEGVGVVSMPDWKDTFSAHLGTLRSFLESRPEFVVIPRRGGKFHVAPVNGACSSHAMLGNMPA